MTTRKDISFEVAGGITLRGWLYVPSSSQEPHPAITMTHGFAGVKEHGLERFAEAFVDAGFAVLLHDHRNFGGSDGTPRQDVNPWTQIADWRRAISFLEARPEVDPARLGLWGTSYSGGHALVLGATDRRLKCIVSQVPTISGYEQGVRRVSPDALPAFLQTLLDDERAQARGEPARTQAVVSADMSQPAAYRSPDAISFYTQPLPEGVWKNEVTLRSTALARTYEPGVWAARVSPTPLLMVIGTNDTLTMTDLELAAYEQALQPKQLCLIPGGHFAPYQAGFFLSSAAAVGWFTKHLGAQ
ncbi:fermentation-respiration switch protein FrsA (DUF1100 family) [Paraburkholderia sp. GAS199]|uniref:alpha/beta hydrolase n=1 Tax=Paraburkholderia sp. GAS199 TaxID=3035126 RepID=UPI003D1E31DF